MCVCLCLSVCVCRTSIYTPTVWLRWPTCRLSLIHFILTSHNDLSSTSALCVVTSESSDQSNLTKSSHHLCIWMVQSCSSRGNNVHLYLTYASLGSPESVPQTASRLIPLFLHRSRHSVPILCNGLPLPSQNCPFSRGM